MCGPKSKSLFWKPLPQLNSRNRWLGAEPDDISNLLNIEEPDKWHSFGQMNMRMTEACHGPEFGSTLSK